jgi:hypothetical protein
LLILSRSVQQTWPPQAILIIWQCGFREEDLKISANQKQELPVAAMFVNGSGQNEQFYKGPSIDASYQVSVHYMAATGHSYY